LKKILITGAKGFLGSNVAKYFKALGFKTYGIGHGDLFVEECEGIGLDYWYKSSVTIQAIKEINQKFDVIVHCGGSGSVGFSVEYPYEDFKKTVDGTLEVLEYMRLYNSNAHLIYPSSPAVQGECEDKPIEEDYVGKPVSPYGYHKKIAEDLCRSYSDKYNIQVSIIRLFSVYGEGLKKQLLWDAYHKIRNADSEEVMFWGTGDETRDFIHVDDVLSIIKKLLEVNDRFMVINGGTGTKHTVKGVVNMIKNIVNTKITIKFNNQVNIGNPRYYWADTKKIEKLGIAFEKEFKSEIVSYIDWVRGLND
jgi:UDP-glucose 4-epimerase